VYTAPTRHLEVGRLGDALVIREIPKGGFPVRDAPPLPGPPPPLMRCGFYAEDRLVQLDSAFQDVQDVRMELLRAPDGSVEFLRYGGRLHRHARPS
jgi:hypothetical protein